MHPKEVHSENFSKPGLNIVLTGIILVSLFLHLIFWLLGISVLDGWFFKSYPAHALFEGVGSFIAFFVAALLLVENDAGFRKDVRTIIACALVGMGTLDGVHAALHEGSYFVWLHSSATFFGGVLFLLLWLPDRLRTKIRRRSVIAVVFASLAYASFFYAWPHMIPRMINANGEFTLVAKLSNIIGGMCMLLAALKLILEYKRYKQQESLLFFIHCMLFGLAGIMFEQSVLWDITWWGWHILRFLAYGVALFFAINNYHLVQAALTRQRSKIDDLKKFELIFETHPDVIFLIDKAGIVTKVNSNVLKVLGYKREEVEGQNVDMLVPDEVRKDHPQHRRDFMNNPSSRRMGMGRELYAKAKSKHLIPVEITLNSINVGDEKFALVHLEDVSERKRLEKVKIEREILANENAQLKKIAIKDPLTGVLNRRGFQPIFFSALNKIKVRGGSAQLILVDIDNFKKINDQYGYGVGDLALKELIKQVSIVLRDTDEFCRIGGDEFLILLRDTNEAGGMLVATKIITAFRNASIGVGQGELVQVTASIGMGKIEPDIYSLDQTLEILHDRLRNSKRMGKDCITDGGVGTFQDGESDDLVELKRKMISEKWVYSVKQPIVRMSDQHTVGYEMLARSTLNEFSSPVEFLAFANSNNILNTVDLICLKAAVDASFDLGEQNIFHVNIYPSTLISYDIKTIIELFRRGNISQYCIEISEQQILGDPYNMREKICELKDAGFQIALDDVGFGHSSLEGLLCLEPDIVKIDRSVIQNIERHGYKQKQLRRLLDIIKSCGANPIAEGIETQVEAEIVGELGVVYAQGFFYGRPA